MRVTGTVTSRCAAPVSYTVRVAVRVRHLAEIPDSVRKLTSEQIARIREVLRADLEAGTYGMSTGLEYVPGIYSDPEEVLALAREVGAAGGVVMSHMRSENDETINQSIDELAAHISPPN